ncbi:MAG TPA: hypothetical protein PLP19_06480 [bacterium]|nr:hypothetical protein [bacterium]HPN43115.1 hypothetical protein [bacterium]
MPVIIRKTCFILYVALSVIDVWAQTEQPPSNLQVFQNLFRAGFMETLLVGEKPDSSELYFINSGTNRDLNWLVNEQFFSAAQSSGFENIYQVIAPVGLNNGKNYFTEFRPLEQKIEYVAAPGLSRDRCLRTATINMFVQVTAPDQQVIFSGSRQMTGVDTILVRQIDKLENPEFLFTIGAKSKSFISGLVEPVLVMVITGIVIYIFYSFRSK